MKEINQGEKVDTYKPVSPLWAQMHVVVVVDYLALVLTTNYSLNILIFNNLKIQYFPIF